MIIVPLSNLDLEGLSADELVQRFADIGAAQDEAELERRTLNRTHILLP